MSFKEHMQGDYDLRTLQPVDAFYALQHGKYATPVLEMDPTSRCNHKCISCYTNHRNRKGLEWRDDVFRNSFMQIADAGMRAVVFQGKGEAFDA